MTETTKPEAQQSILAHTITRTIAALEANRNAADIIRVQHAEIERLRGVLTEAKLQIEYLHDKFQETGSGNAVIARIKDALS